MRLYTTLEEAAREIKRDLYKSPEMKVTRVQQRDGQELRAREAMGMTYAITPEGIPDIPEALLRIGQQMEMPAFVDHATDVTTWMLREIRSRCFPELSLGEIHETLHPALKSCLEGNYPSYTYAERMLGAKEAILAALSSNADTRRAYWPIFRPEDAFRACAPTRIPCSLGYELMIREVNGEARLNITYLQRSADFDMFWLTDVWFAHRFREYIRDLLYNVHGIKTKQGAFIHHIISFHSFFAAGSEVY